MIEPSTVYGVGTAVYLASFAVLAAWTRRLPDRYDGYSHPVLLVVAVTAATSAMHALEIGVVPLGGGELDVANLVSSLVAYPVLWGLAAETAGVSRRLFGLVVGLSVAQVLIYQLAAIVGGLVGLVALLLFVAGYALQAYLFLRPVWRVARDRADEQRLLHWKLRNLLLFLVGTIIVLAVLAVGGVFDAVTGAVLLVYIDFLIRIGTAGFLFANVSAIDDTDGGLRSTLSGATGTGSASGVR